MRSAEDTLPHKNFRESMGEKDWYGPLSDLIYTVFLLLKDGIEIVALMGVALGVKTLLGVMSVPPLVISGVAIPAEQIIKNYDYALLFGFLIVQGFKLMKSMVRS